MTRTENLLDRALAYFFPAWASARLQARARGELFRRSLEAGGINRTSSRSSYRREGPRNQTKRDLETTRAQARELYRYNPICRGTINSIVANLVGTGIRPQPRVMRPKLWTPDESFNDAAEEAWKRFSDGADLTGKESYYGQQQLLERELFVAGEGLVLLRTIKGRDVPLAAEILPSERLALVDEPDRKDGTKAVQGVEFDAAGGIKGYWIYPNHPFDSGRYGSNQQVLIPAEQVIHFFEPVEPGAVRGLTRLLTVAGAFEGFSQWLDWLLTKERVASAFAVAIMQNTSLAIQSPIAVGSSDSLTDEAGRDLDYLEGGIIAHLRPGESIQGVSSGVQASSVDLLSQIFLRVIARGLDVSYELVSRDLSKVTYLSARQGENQDRRHWEPLQESLNRQVNSRVWRAFVQAAMVKGLLPARGPLDRYLDVEWVRPGWDWIDPQKDLEADVQAVQAGLRSPIEAILRRGKDPYKVLSEIALYKQWAEDMGLDYLTAFNPKTAPAAPAEAPEPKTGIKAAG